MQPTLHMPPDIAPSAPEHVRFVCHCQPSGVLLATFDASGLITIKCRDRWFRVRGAVQATCPRCGAVHRLDAAVSVNDLMNTPTDERSR